MGFIILLDEENNKAEERNKRKIIKLIINKYN
jgi:hypothetical protein